MASDFRKNTVHPPSRSSVLYLIYQKDGDGASSYEVENGSWVNYWYGYSFDLGGEHYFTGFTWQTPDDYATAQEDASVAVDAKVTIGQATLVIAQPLNVVKPWRFQGSDQFVGELGGYAKPNEIDGTRPPQAHETRDGKLLLALPTWYLAAGTRISSFDLFLFNPGELSRTDERRWTYLGNVTAGADNGAACDEQEASAIPSAKSFGTLEFVDQDDCELPLIRIAMGGTRVVVDGEGQARTVWQQGQAEYRHDASSRRYQ